MMSTIALAGTHLENLLEASIEAFVRTPTGTLTWIALPLFVGFSIYLLPKLDRVLALSVAGVSLVYGLLQVSNSRPAIFQLLDSFGVSLRVDTLSGYFVLTNAIVTAAVIFYCWQKQKGAFFYTQVTVLHGSVNAVFVCADLISLYVALEVIGIAAFLLIAYPRTDRAIWVALRYLFVSNTAMLFYLVGAVLVYQSSRSFAFTGLAGAPNEAIALIFLGLLTKGGIFVSGLWLPLTHAESETPVSALLSGVVIKAGVFPLVRLALMVPILDPIVRLFGVATAILGVSYAVFATDTKRLLAFSTVSQMGFVLAAPAVGGFYALTHGLVKSALFLIAGNLPNRSFKTLMQNPMPTPIWVVLAIASLSISGFPLLAGFGAKVLTIENLLPWQVIVINIAAVGTAISFAKFIFLPHSPQLALSRTSPSQTSPSQTSPSQTSLSHVDPDTTNPHKLETHDTNKPQKTTNPGFWPAIILLLGALVLANGFYYEAYSLSNLFKPLATIAAGWLAYLLIFQKVTLKLPQAAEQFEHIIGGMSLMLTLLFWMVMP